MKLNSIIPALALLLLLPSLALALPVTVPGPTATDSSTGAAVTSGVTAAVASVTDLDGVAKATSTAAAHVAGGNTSTVYDAAVNGEAWVTLTLTASGHAFAPVVIFCSGDPSIIASTNASTVSLAGGQTTLQNGQTGLAATQALIKAQADKIGTAAANTPSAPVWFVLPTDFLSAGEKTQIAAAAAAQPAGQPVTLPATAPAGYGVGSGGSVIVGGYTTGQDPATLLAGSFSAVPSAVLSRSIGHGMTVGQLLVLLQASNGPGAVTNTWNPITHTLTTAYQFTGDSAPVRSDGTLYPLAQVTAPPVVSRTTTLGAISQP